MCEQVEIVHAEFVISEFGIDFVKVFGIFSK